LKDREVGRENAKERENKKNNSIESMNQAKASHLHLNLHKYKTRRKISK